MFQLNKKEVENVSGGDGVCVCHVIPNGSFSTTPSPHEYFFSAPYECKDVCCKAPNLENIYWEYRDEGKNETASGSCEQKNSGIKSFIASRVRANSI